MKLYDDFRFWRTKRQILADVRKNIVRQDTYGAYNHVIALTETTYRHLTYEQRQEVINFIIDKII